MGVSLHIIFVTFLLGFAKHIAADIGGSFDQNYEIGYGNVWPAQNGTFVTLSMDEATQGGGRFRSKKGYGSGFFQMSMKLPSNPSPGVVTTFYLTSSPDNQPGNHEELDFEFLGSDGPPYTLQTNVFADDDGNREQRMSLWFNPSEEFHKYGILWNYRQIVFLVDDIPVRVYKDFRKIGANYPTQQMFVMGSMWNGEAWASNGRRVDWSQAPFQAYYQGFNIDGCEVDNNNNKCYAENFWWNQRRYWNLSRDQRRAYRDVKMRYLTFDYCSERAQFFKECQADND